jgi:hypothetical protein
MFHVPAVVSELTARVSLNERLRTADVDRLARFATAHEKAETKPNRIFQIVRSRLAVIRRAPQRLLPR